jgi:contractile injection system tube protein
MPLVPMDATADRAERAINRPTRLEKGALLVYRDQSATQPDQRINFQFNPDNVRRSFAARSVPPPPAQRTAGQADALAVPGPPVETITIAIVLNAADQLDDPSLRQEVAEHGLNAALARLELLLYPSTASAEEVERQAQRGQVQVSPARTPLVMLAWGRTRTVPVQLTSFTVTEEAFDPNLNPINAKVDLGLKVLTYMEFPTQSAGREAFIAYQKERESLARGQTGGAR